MGSACRRLSKRRIKVGFTTWQPASLRKEAMWPSSRHCRTGGSSAEDGGWRMEDGGWRMEDEKLKPDPCCFRFRSRARIHFQLPGVQAVPGTVENIIQSCFETGPQFIPESKAAPRLRPSQRGSTLHRPQACGSVCSTTKWA
jgi:hypothetical protein